MKIRDMREAIKAAYTGPRWASRVDQMNDAQVIAVYSNLKEQEKV